MQVSHIIKLTDFLPYVIIGALATCIDWGIYSLLVIWLKWYYQIALVVAYITAAIIHYIANKLFTFKCSSKQLGSQLSIYLTIILSSLLLSMGILFCLIHFFALSKILGRILTTLLMIVPNYLLHKHITFSKKLFAPASISPEVIK